MMAAEKEKERSGGKAKKVSAGSKPKLHRQSSGGSWGASAKR